MSFLPQKCRNHETRWSCKKIERKYTNLAKNCIILQIWLWHSNEGSRCSALEILNGKALQVNIYHNMLYWGMKYHFLTLNTKHFEWVWTIHPTSIFHKSNLLVDWLKTLGSVGCLHYNWVNHDSRVFHKLCDELVIHHCFIPAVTNPTVKFPWELGNGLE